MNVMQDSLQIMMRLWWTIWCFFWKRRLPVESVRMWTFLTSHHKYVRNWVVKLFLLCWEDFIMCLLRSAIYQLQERKRPHWNVRHFRTSSHPVSGIWPGWWRIPGSPQHSQEVNKTFHFGIVMNYYLYSYIFIKFQRRNSESELYEEWGY